MNKRAFEFSFSWLFAIIVGAVIIFLAIFAAFQIGSTQQVGNDLIQAKQISALLSPLETTIESGNAAKITLPGETRLYNECDLAGTFGSQRLSTATKNTLNGKWMPEPDLKTTSRNKYLFSNEIIQTKKNLYLFSLPFEFPFKIANPIFLWSDMQGYCFVSPPDEVAQTLKGLANPPNLFINDSPELCPPSTTALKINKVCFGIGSINDCDIYVPNVISGSSPYLEKMVGGSSVQVPYVDQTTLFAAIFSDPDIYTCQMKRLLSRSSEIAHVLQAKSEYLSTKGCGSGNLILSIKKGTLPEYRRKVTLILQSPQGIDPIALSDLKVESDGLNSKNDDLQCKLF